MIKSYFNLKSLKKNHFSKIHIKIKNKNYNKRNWIFDREQ